MELGFDTIGNAILICYDKRPILATDPWMSDNCYFGSWGHSHAIPREQREAVMESKYIWISHGHPDHLDGKTLRHFQKQKKILVPDHVGNRIKDGLAADGYDITVLKDRTWYQLSDRIRVLTIADINQDAILLVDIGGVLVFDCNDASDNGWGGYVRKIIKKYKRSFMMALSSRYGDADMINLFNEDGSRIPKSENVPDIGQRNAWRAEEFGAKFFIPFSSMHVYQRSDSIWANDLHTGLADYQTGFASKTVTGLEPFIRYDCLQDRVTPIRPDENPINVQSPETFGDDWSETLDQQDLDTAEHYFKRIDHLKSTLGFINLKVGGEDNHIDLSGRRDKGVTFEAPRGSLMTAIKYQVFDDMLIGNFMKTTLHGNWGAGGLYPDFTPYVAKYSDNGLASSETQIAAYAAAYKRRMGMGGVKHAFERSAEHVFRSWIPEEGRLFKRAKKMYWFYKRVLR